MESALRALQLLATAGLGIFCLYQCFGVGDNGGTFSKPVAGWTLRAGLIAAAAFCFFTVARLAATR